VSAYLDDALATYRLTRLAVVDEFPPAEWVRQKVLGWSDGGPASYLITCPYCVSVYVGFGVLAARKIAPRSWGYVAQALALASLGALVVQLDEQLHGGLHVSPTVNVNMTTPRSLP
jgi:hypothetical protein